MNYQDPRLLPTCYLLLLPIIAFLLGQLSERSVRGDLFWVAVVLNSIVIAFLLYSLIARVWKPRAERS